MSKLIYITESQLNEIVGNGTYLNNQDNSNEFRLGSTEISADGITGNYIDGDAEQGNPTTTDKIAKRMARNKPRGMGRNILPESNQDLTGKQNTFQISPLIIDKLKKQISSYQGAKDAPGVKRINNIINKGRMSYDDAYRVLDDMQTGKAGDILNGDDSLRKEIERKVNTATSISQNNRDNKMARGENVLKSAPKTGAKGGAHTPKGNNVIGVTYEN